MREITEAELHLYHINPTLLDGEIVSDIEELIRTDPEFGKAYQEVKEFYSKYEELASQETRRYVLKSFESNEKSKGSFRLAALQNNPQVAGRKYIKTFLSAENYIMARLFYDPGDEEYTLFIISEGSHNDVAHAVVGIKGIEKSFIANERGITKIKGCYLDQQKEITISLPLAKVEFAGGEIIDSATELHEVEEWEEEFELQVEMKGDLVSCRIEGARSNEIHDYRLIAFEKGKETECVSFDTAERVFSFPRPKANQFTVILVERRPQSLAT